MINPLPVHSIEKDKVIHDLSNKLAYRTFGYDITRNPDLLARWKPIIQKEIFGYLNNIFCCDDAFFKQYPYYKIGKGVIILQGRFAMLGNLPNPLKKYCNTLGIFGLRFFISMATFMAG